MKKSFIAQIIVTLTCVTGFMTHAAVIAHWSFDSDYTDSSASGNDLSAYTISNATVGITTTAGEYKFGGGALDISSTETNEAYLTLASAINFTATDAWSVSFWVRRAADSTDKQGMVLGNPSNNANFLWASGNPLQVEGMRFRSSTYSSGIDFGGHPDDGAWHHWVVVADGTGNVDAYRDNVAQTGTNITTSAFNITAVGDAYTDFVNSMNGQIDELYIYNEAIGAATVSNLFGETVGPDTTAPVLNPDGFVDNRAGGPVTVYSLVTYTVTFSEDMDASTVTSADFENAGSSAISIRTVTENSPGVFSVEVLPTSVGSLQLAISASAVLSDVAGNPLDTTSAIPDDTTITVQEALAAPTVQQIKVYLLGGQSNADGRADPSGLPTSPVNLQEPQADVDFYKTELSTLRPLVQFGPEVTLGKRLADSVADGVNTRVAIIKYGKGGTSLYADWAPGGDATTSGDGPQYTTFQGVVADGLNALAAAYTNASIEIEGMLWVQGERDVVIEQTGTYEANLTAFIADVRATYGSDLPFVISRLSDGQTALASGGLAAVRSAQAAVASADPLADLLDTDGFGIQADNLHFDAQGQQLLGDGAAFKLLNFLPIDTSPGITVMGSESIDISFGSAFPDFVYILQSNPALDPEGWVDVESLTANVTQVNFDYTLSSEEMIRFFRIARMNAL